MIDCTLGCGGHTLDYMQTFLNLHIVGLDWD
jgi:16S rRNA C1402 N4-methylase RsmH